MRKAEDLKCTYSLLALVEMLGSELVVRWESSTETTPEASREYSSLLDTSLVAIFVFSDLRGR